MKKSRIKAAVRALELMGPEKFDMGNWGTKVNGEISTLCFGGMVMLLYAPEEVKWDTTEGMEFLQHRSHSSYYWSQPEMYENIGLILNLDEDVVGVITHCDIESLEILKNIITQQTGIKF